MEIFHNFTCTIAGLTLFVPGSMGCQTHYTALMMPSIKNRILQWVAQTPVRTFILYPSLVLAWELYIHEGSLHVQPTFLLLMPWGYLQYRVCGGYRKRIGGGGPGLQIPPEHLVTTGIYAWTRNPMYLGHIIFLVGLSLTLMSILAGLITIVTALWFHFRVTGDEKDLAKQFGQPYVDYSGRVKRWIPGIF
ncbi:MAG: isoprenylcysteine carboxylmethyltransferase family protein [Candidatus Binatia bacterium]